MNIVYANGENDVNINFKVAFNTLANRLKNSPTETLVLLCTYMACSGTEFNPQVYVDQLLRYFKNFAESNTLGFTEKDIIPITDATRVYDMTGSTAKAYVQEWARVSPTDNNLNAIGIYTGYTPYAEVLGDGELWVRWPASIEEKKFAIKKLFENSVATSGDNTTNDLYINSLSGYYIDWDNTLTYDKSTLPFKKSFKIMGHLSGREYDSALGVTGQGKGGNFKLLAYDLNKYVYDLINNKEIASGPLGLVIMDHIGNNAVKQIGPGTSEQTVTDDKSLDLVDLIMRNNFKYSLGKGAEIEEP